MRASLLKETLKSLYPAKRTVCIEGPPGGGKTSIVRQVAEELNVEYIEVCLSLMLVEDLGVQYPDGDTLKYKIPEWFPTDPKSEGILCFDDRNQAKTDLQTVFANICQARKLHGKGLPDGWMVVSTGNRQSDRAGANRVLSHVRNRETVLELDSSIDDWTTWAVKNNVAAEVLGFLRFRPDFLHKFDPQMDSNPSPRSWVEGVSAVIGLVPREAEFDCFKGAVGEGPATEFNAFNKVYRNLPDPDDAIKNPTTTKLPEEQSAKYAMSVAVSRRITTKNFDSALAYIERMPKELSILAVNMAIMREPALLECKAFATWAIDNKDVVLG